MYQTGRDASLPLALLLSFNVGDTTCHLPRLRRARDIIFVTWEDVMDLMSASHVCIAFAVSTFIQLQMGTLTHG